MSGSVTKGSSGVVRQLSAQLRTNRAPTCLSYASCSRVASSRKSAISSSLCVRDIRSFQSLSRKHAELADRLNLPSQTNTEPPSQPPKRRPIRSFLIFLGIATVAFSSTFLLTAAPAIQTANEILTPPTDEESLLMFQPDPTSHAAEVNNFILNHPLVKQLEADEKFIASRPHLKIPPSMRPHNFTGGTLLGGDMIVVPPLTFSTPDGSEFVSFQYLGKDMCGHPGIVHGGLLATLMDEGLARCCFNALPHKVGVTATLTVNYRKPTMAGQFVVLKAKTTKVDGRKAWVQGKLMALRPYGAVNDGSALQDGDVYVEAEALFIEPKQAATMARIYSTSTAPPPKKGEHQTQPGPSG